MKLAFIGGGNMAQALLAGLASQHADMREMIVVELDDSKRAGLEKAFGVVTSNQLSDTANVDAIVLAVKPQQLPSLAKTLAPVLKQQLVVSIAAGIKLAALSEWLNNYPTIVRAMPNTPAQIQAGITGLYALPDVSKQQIELADQILRAAGTTIWLDSEDKLDAVTAISGSGPAYVFYLIEALEAAALELGLSAEEAKELSLTTFKGASLLADQSQTPVATLREQVTSKKGTTEQGLISLANDEVKAAVIRAAQKAHQRAKTLADELAKEGN